MADRMSPKAQIAARNSREKEIASIANPAQRDSALSVYNREKGVARAKASLASAQPAGPPKHRGIISTVQAGMDALLKALNPKGN